MTGVLSFDGAKKKAVGVRGNRGKVGYGLICSGKKQKKQSFVVGNPLTHDG